MEWYYKTKDPYYKKLPPFDPNCSNNDGRNMGIIYPKKTTKIFIPKGFSSQLEKIVFEIAHRIPETEVHWHLDDKYLGSTKSIHKMEISSCQGMHFLTLVDEYGEELNRNFEVLKK